MTELSDAEIERRESDQWENQYDPAPIRELTDQEIERVGKLFPPAMPATVDDIPFNQQKRIEHDHYPTPTPLVQATVERLASNPDHRYLSMNILDPGAGNTGVWGLTLRRYLERTQRSNISLVERLDGCELRDVAKPDGYDNWYLGNYLDILPAIKYHWIIGNPPYKLAEEFVHKSLDLLYPDMGVACFLLRLNFLEGQKRYKSLWQHRYLNHVLVLDKRPSFDGKGTDATGYAVMMFSHYAPGFPTLDFLSWS